jgi:F-type H+-transporting ATPase subunit a
VAVLAAGGAEAGGMPDPIHQFDLHRIVNLNVGGWDLSFTNSALFMLLAVALTTLFLMVATQARALVPGRLQSVAEVAHDFIANMCRESMGKEGMKFFPFVFALFVFIFVCNMLGLIPGFFTVTSHIVVTAALAALVFLTVLVVGFAKNGLHFLKLFVSSGVPIYVLPLVTLIEIISFLSRPISHSVRLFANMMAGHTMLKVFAGFVVGLGVLGGWAPFAFVVAFTGLEVVVAFLQALIFTVLTCIYLNDALHMHH